MKTDYSEASGVVGKGSCNANYSWALPFLGPATDDWKFMVRKMHTNGWEDVMHAYFMTRPACTDSYNSG